MKKYNVANYIRYKEDLKTSMPDDKPYKEYTRNELVVKFMPLVETMARKFSTSDQASGILSINDFIQEGNYSLTRAVASASKYFFSDSCASLESTIERTSLRCLRLRAGLRRRRLLTATLRKWSWSCLTRAGIVVLL